MSGGHIMAQRSKIQTRSVGERISKGSFPSVNDNLNSTGMVAGKQVSVSNRPSVVN